MVNVMKSDLKIRVISAIVALIIVIPILILGGYWFYAGAGIISIIGFYEILMLRDNQKKIPSIMKIVASLCFMSFILTCINVTDFIIDTWIFVLIPLVLLTPLLFYGKSKEYDANDAFYLIASTMFLGIAFRYLIVIRTMNIHFIIYLLMVTIMTDTFAHFFGTKLGRVKLCPYVSPNKTVEGMAGGTFFGTFIASIYYLTFINASANALLVIAVSLLLSLVAQVGDLVFSAIKRKYDVKDYGNIMPGHGGVLDRLDSLIFAMLVFSLLYEILIVF